MKKLLLGLLLVTSLLAYVPKAQAEIATPTPTPVPGGVSETANCVKGFLGFPNWYKYLELDSQCNVVGPRLATSDDPDRLDMAKVTTRVSLAVLEILMRLGGIIAFGMVVYSGFLFVLSNGDSNKAKQARETAINAGIGLVISIFAVAIVSFIGNSLK